MLPKNFLLGSAGKSPAPMTLMYLIVNFVDVHHNSVMLRLEAQIKEICHRIFRMTKCRVGAGIRRQNPVSF